MPGEPRDATQMLREHAEGDPSASDRLMPLVYDALRALAARQMAREPADHLLEPTAIVHEAYLRLVDQDRVDWRGRTHFFAIAAEMVRRLLVDHARAEKTLKRGGGWRRITVSDVLGVAPDRPLDLLVLDEALERLEELSPRQAKVVRLRFFGGLGVDEIALALSVSPRTVKGDWRMARAWLMRELCEDEGR
ncbi:MAG: sigma-70 family RNA polymerase sigma factor [Planctomycetota bacterium]